jgi:C-terminal processing protease CtpA/Prc
MSSGEVLETLYASVPTDGNDAGRLRYDTERWFAALYYTYVGTPDAFNIGILRPEADAPANVDIPAVRDASLATTAQGVMHDTADTPWSISYENSYAKLTIPTFNYSDKDAYSEFLLTVFSEIKERNIGILVLDLRGNYGGTPFPTVELFRYLIPKPLPFFAVENPFYLSRWKKPVAPAEAAFEGTLRVLVDEAGFSMNGFLLSLLKYHEIGMLIGAASSGGYKCSDASKTVTLRNTGIRLRYSTAVFQSAVEGFKEGTGIEPDIRVEWTADDYIHGNDPVLKAALHSAGL